MNQGLQYVTFISNLVIVIGYIMVAVGVAPNFKSDTSLTRVGGVFFFLLCGATHLEHIAHWLTGEPISQAEYGSYHMALIHGPQALAVVAFIAGLYHDQAVTITPQGLPTKAVDKLLTAIAESKRILRVSDFLDRQLHWCPILLALLIALGAILEG